MPSQAKFVDHYSVLDASPETPLEDLKQAYHLHLREFHPDKGRTETGFGVQKTQALNEAWNALKDATRRRDYDVSWHRERRRVDKLEASEKRKKRSRGVVEIAAERELKERQHEDNQAEVASVVKFGTLTKEAPADTTANGFSKPKAPPPPSEGRRVKGNRHYKEAQALMIPNGDCPPDRHTCKRAVQEFQLAIKEYSEGLRVAPRDHRLWSNRALCYAALEEWSQCREDALYATQLEPNFMKGWFLLAKATWKSGSLAAAQAELQAGLRNLPSNPELLALQVEIHAHMGSQEKAACSPELHLHFPYGVQHSRGALPPAPARRTPANYQGRSPCVTPEGSCTATPPRAHSSSRSPAPSYLGASPGCTTTPPGCHRVSTPRLHSSPRSPELLAFAAAAAAVLQEQQHRSEGYGGTSPRAHSDTHEAALPPICSGTKSPAVPTRNPFCRDASPGWDNTPPRSHSGSRVATPVSVRSSSRSFVNTPPRSNPGSRVATPPPLRSSSRTPVTTPPRSNPGSRVATPPQIRNSSRSPVSTPPRYNTGPRVVTPPPIRSSSRSPVNSARNSVHRDVSPGTPSRGRCGAFAAGVRTQHTFAETVRAQTEWDGESEHSSDSSSGWSNTPSVSSEGTPLHSPERNRSASPVNLLRDAHRLSKGRVSQRVSKAFTALGADHFSQ